MIERNEKLTWRNVVQPIENITDRIGISWGIVNHLHSVKNSEAFREAYSKVTVNFCTFILQDFNFFSSASLN